MNKPISLFLEKILSILLLISILLSCNIKKTNPDWEFAKQQLSKGELSMLISWSDSIQSITEITNKNWMKADSFKRIAKRILLDFRYDEEEIKKQLTERVGNFTPMEKTHWEANNFLEVRMIDGDKRYFKYAVSNLIRK